MKLSATTTDTLLDILRDRRSVSFENEAGMFPIQGLTATMLGHPLSRPFEVPPPGLDRKAMTEVLIATDDSPKGRWIRVIVLTYAVGGHVHYCEVTPGVFEATLAF